MQEKVEACLQHLAVEEAKRAEAYRKKVLLDVGLCEKKYDLESEDMDRYGPPQIDAQTEKYFVYVPVDLTDEEWAAVEAAYQKYKAFNDNEKETSAPTKNSVASVLTALSVLTYIGGFFYGFILASRYYGFSVEIFLVYCLIALFCGTMLLGFSQIIKLLQAIRDNGGKR